MNAPAVPTGLALGGAVGAAVAHLGPAVVAPGDDAVEFVAALGAVFVHPQFAGTGTQGRPLRVAVAVGPDLRAGLADARVALRDAAVAVEPDDLAEGAVEVLGGVELLALAERHEHRLVGAEHDPGAEVAGAGGLRHLPVDHLDVREGVADQAAARQGGAREGLFGAATRLGVGPVDPGVACKVGVDRDIEQTALVAEHDRRHGERGERAPALGVEQQDRPRLLGDEHAAIREEGETPGALEAAVEDDRARGDGLGHGLLSNDRRSRRRQTDPREQGSKLAHGDSGQVQLAPPEARFAGSSVGSDLNRI